VKKAVTTHTTTVRHEVRAILGNDAENLTDIWFFIPYSASQGQFLFRANPDAQYTVGGCEEISNTDSVAVFQNVEFVRVWEDTAISTTKRNEVLTLKTDFTKEQLLPAEKALRERLEEALNDSQDENE
jgi:hypothetical protein